MVHRKSSYTLTFKNFNAGDRWSLYQQNVVHRNLYGDVNRGHEPLPFDEEPCDCDGSEKMTETTRKRVQKCIGMTSPARPFDRPYQSSILSTHAPPPTAWRNSLRLTDRVAEKCPALTTSLDSCIFCGCDYALNMPDNCYYGGSLDTTLPRALRNTAAIKNVSGSRNISPRNPSPVKSTSSIGNTPPVRDVLNTTSSCVVGGTAATSANGCKAGEADRNNCTETDIAKLYNSTIKTEVTESSFTPNQQPVSTTNKDKCIRFKEDVVERGTHGVLKCHPKLREYDLLPATMTNYRPGPRDGRQHRSWNSSGDRVCHDSKYRHSSTGVLLRNSRRRVGGSVGDLANAGKRVNHDGWRVMQTRDAASTVVNPHRDLTMSAVTIHSRQPRSDGCGPRQPRSSSQPRCCRGCKKMVY